MVHYFCTGQSQGEKEKLCLHSSEKCGSGAVLWHEVFFILSGVVISQLMKAIWNDVLNAKILSDNDVMVSGISYNFFSLVCSTGVSFSVHI